MGKLYERCQHCDKDGKYSGMNEMGFFIRGRTCPACQGEKYVEVGLTIAQVDRMVQAQRRREGDPSAYTPEDCKEVGRLTKEVERLREFEWMYKELSK